MWYRMVIYDKALLTIHRVSKLFKLNDYKIKYNDNSQGD